MSDMINITETEKLFQSTPVQGSEGFLGGFGYVPVGSWMIPVLGVLLLVPTLIALVITYRAILRGINKRIKLEGLSPEVYNGVKLVIRIIFGIVIIIAVISFLNVNSEYVILLSSLVTGAILFASVKTINNFIAGIWIIVSRPFTVGDYVKINSLEGIVMEISLNYTQILHPDETTSLIPNMKCMESKIVNFTISLKNLETRKKRLHKLLKTRTEHLGDSESGIHSKKDPEDVSENDRLEDRTVTSWIRQELRNIDQSLKLFEETPGEPRRGELKEPNKKSRYYDKDKFVRYSFIAKLPKNPERNAEKLESLFKKWECYLLTNPYWQILSIDAQINYTILFYTRDPMDVVNYQSELLADIYRAVFGP